MMLVAGATGLLGGRIARMHLESGGSVRALARSDASGRALAEAGAESATGDLRDPATLASVCDGVDVVISTASATSRTDDTPQNVDGNGNRNLIDAAVRAGVRKFILISSIGASTDSPVPAFRAKAEAEGYLRSSGLDHTIFRANGFMDVWFGMLIEAPLTSGLPVTLIGESVRRHSFIAVTDVASFMLAAVDHPGAHNETFAIGGPAAITLRDAVRAYEQAVGRSIEVRSVAPGSPIPGIPEPVWGIAAALETFDSPIPMEELSARFGVAPTSAEEFARRSVAARGLL